VRHFERFSKNALSEGNEFRGRGVERTNELRLTRSAIANGTSLDESNNPLNPRIPYLQNLFKKKGGGIQANGVSE